MSRGTSCPDSAHEPRRALDRGPDEDAAHLCPRVHARRLREGFQTKRAGLSPLSGLERARKTLVKRVGAFLLRGLLRSLRWKRSLAALARHFPFLRTHGSPLTLAGAPVTDVAMPFRQHLAGELACRGYVDASGPLAHVALPVEPDNPEVNTPTSGSHHAQRVAQACLSCIRRNPRPLSAGGRLDADGREPEDRDPDEHQALDPRCSPLCSLGGPQRPVSRHMLARRGLR
jgi:hypothetical protein